MSKNRTYYRNLNEDDWENAVFFCTKCNKEISEFEYNMRNGICADCDKKDSVLRRRQRKFSHQDTMMEMEG